MPAISFNETLKCIHAMQITERFKWWNFAKLYAKLYI